MKKCCRQHRINMYRDSRRPRWQRYSVYCLGILILCAIGWYILRDTTPVIIKTPDLKDLSEPPAATVGSDKLDDVYWRMATRHVNNIVEKECTTTNYNLFTNKNIALDGGPMKESYIYICSENPVVNARVVLSGQSVQSVKCKETYASKTKVVVREYPFSLKYISAVTFLPETKVIRTATQACLWQHAIEIVESRWD